MKKPAQSDWKRQKSEELGYSITKEPSEAIESLKKLEEEMEREPITKIFIDGKGTEKQIRPKTPTELVREQLPPENLIETPGGKHFVDWRRIVQLNIEATNLWKEHYPFINEKDIKAEAEYPDKPQLFFFDSDWHLGAIGFAGKRFIEDIDTLLTTPNCFMATFGDEIDVGMFGRLAHLQAIPRYSQMYAMKGLTRELSGQNPRERRIWQWICAGNHTMTLFEKSGLLYEGYFQEAEIPMFPGMGIVNLKVGEQEYKGAFAHKFHMGRSRLNLTLMAKRIIEFFSPEADFAISGHYHQKAFEVFEKGKQERLAIATGSRRIDEVLFELSKGYGYPSEGGVCVLFYPDEKKMLPFRHLRDGIKFLKSELK